MKKHVTEHAYTWSFPKVPISFFLLLLMAAGGAYWWFYHAPVSPGDNGGDYPSLDKYHVEVFRTKGGLLEVAGLKKTEELGKSITSWRGTSFSKIRFQASYRYSIVLPQKWRILIDDTRQVAHVVAPLYHPELPVGIASETVEEYTESGWGRFDKYDLLEELRREVSSRLAERARDANYLKLVQGEARKTVEEFIFDWLLQQKGWKHDTDHTIKVYFSHEEEIPLPKGYSLEELLPEDLQASATLQ